MKVYDSYLNISIYIRLSNNKFHYYDLIYTNTRILLLMLLSLKKITYKINQNLCVKSTLIFD